MCRSAVIALYGRTPREGTGGHVALRRGLPESMRPGGRRADLAGGSRAAGRWPGGGAGLDRGETRRDGGLGRTPLPCREPSRRPPKGRGAETGLAAAAGNGTPQPLPWAASAKGVEGITQPGCESADPGRDGGLPITTQLPHARPASRGAAGSRRAPPKKVPRRTRRRSGAGRSARSRAWRTAPEGSRIRSPRGQGRWPGRGWAAWRGSGRRLSGRRRRPPSLPPAWGRAGSRQGRLRRRGRRP